MTKKQVSPNDEKPAGGMSALNAGLDDAPPICWHINFGRYGQITIRPEEVQHAADGGAKVWLYESGTLMAANDQANGSGGNLPGPA